MLNLTNQPYHIRLIKLKSGEIRQMTTCLSILEAQKKEPVMMTGSNIFKQRCQLEAPSCRKCTIEEACRVEANFVCAIAFTIGAVNVDCG